jgi:hypothetical protein
MKGMSLKVNPQVLQATFENEQILVHPDTGRFFRLNLTAGRLYDLLKSGASLESARETLLSEYEVSSQELEAEIDRIVKFMEEENLLVEDGK